MVRKYFVVLLLMIAAFLSNSQERTKARRSKNLMLELGGSGVAVTANYDFRFNKGRNDGLGMRIGIGGESSSNEPWLIGEGVIKTKLFTVPLELNYILGKRRFSFEAGYSLTYIKGSEHSKIRIFSPEYYIRDEAGNFIVSYLPVGFRLKPKEDGFVLKFNLGPIINYSAPNFFNPGFSDGKIQPWVGLAVGYSFY